MATALFPPPRQFPTGVGYELAAGDFNGDGWLDVVWRNYNTVSVLLNDGDWGQVNPSPLPGDYNGRRYGRCGRLHWCGEIR